MRIVAHVDMDAFFAAVAELDHPWLRGIPVVVGADPKEGTGRGVVSTANYQARAYGIRSGMPIREAWRKSEGAHRAEKPPVFFIGPNFRRYTEVSDRIMKILSRHADAMEEAGIDEAYMDISSCGSFRKAEALARRIKREIGKREHLTASIGIGPNRLVAKIASDMKKPEGLTVVTEDELPAFLMPLPVRKIPGIGPKTEAMLARRGIRTVRDARMLTEEKLRALLGKGGESLYRKIRGIDDTPVGEMRETKSIGEQETFDEDTLDAPFVFRRMDALCGAVIRHFKKSEFRGFRTVVITVRFADFTTHARAHTSPRALSTPQHLGFEAMKLLTPFFDRRENPEKKRIRLIGVRIEKLISPRMVH